MNFLEDGRKDFATTVKLGFPGETPKEKMAKSTFVLEKGQAEGVRPEVISTAYQVFECTWDDTLEDAYLDKSKVGQLEGIEGPYRNFNGVTSKFGCHFILKIDKILMKEKFYNAIINGVKANNFPKVPVDYGLVTSGAKGFFSSEMHKICVQSGMSEVQTVKTIIHEMAHALLHDKTDDPEQMVDPKTKNTKEVEAESIAYVVCQHFGIDTSDYSFGYIAGWSSDKDTKELKASMETIRKTASKMICDCECALAQQQEAEKKDINGTCGFKDR